MSSINLQGYEEGILHLKNAVHFAAVHRQGRAETIRMFNLSPSLFDHWTAKYESRGLDGLMNLLKRADPALRELEEENQRHNRIVANQALELK